VDFVPYPSAAVQVIMQVPSPFAVITPSEETEATLSSEEDHSTDVLLAVVGKAVAVIVFVSPTHREAFVSLRAISVTCCFTVTSHIDFVPYPSAAVQVIVQVPLPFAVIMPFEDTVATLSSEEDHETFVLYAIVGVAVALIVLVSPTHKEVVVSLRAISVTCCFTVTSHVDFVPYPSEAVQVIVQVPCPFAVIIPFEDTVAMLLSEEDHVTFVLFAFVGVAVAVIVLVSPTNRETVVSLRTISFTCCLTVISHVDFVPYPSAAVHVIVQVPCPLAVTIPFEDTVATLLSEEDQLTAVLLDVVGVTVAVRVFVFPTHSEVNVTLRTMAVTGCSTVIVHFAVLPLLVVAVITVVPPPFAVTIPSDETVATSVLEEVHVIVLVVASSGVMVASSFFVMPTIKSSLEFVKEILAGSIIACMFVNSFHP
jgi:hypothetical protein